MIGTAICSIVQQNIIKKKQSLLEQEHPEFTSVKVLWNLFGMDKRQEKFNFLKVRGKNKQEDYVFSREILVKTLKWAVDITRKRLAKENPCKKKVNATKALQAFQEVQRENWPWIQQEINLEVAEELQKRLYGNETFNFKLYLDVLFSDYIKKLALDPVAADQEVTEEMM